jgi:hypothetical protein
MPGTQTSSVRRSMARSVSSDWPAVKVFRLATAGRLIAVFRTVAEVTARDQVFRAWRPGQLTT